MKTIVVISPSYLEAVFKEAEKYSFVIQGYGSFRLAQKGIIYTNASDVLGFAFLGDSIPSSEKDREAMFGFLKYANLMEANKKFLFIVRDGSGLSNYGLEKYKHLRFVELNGYDYVTDTLINKNLFGSILLDNYEPYVFDEKEEPAVVRHGRGALEYCPVVPGIVFEVLSTVHNLDSRDSTLLNDSVLQRYREDPLVTSVRKLVIARKCAWDLQEWLSDAEEQIGKLDGKLYGIYKALTCCIVEGGVLDGC